MKTQHTPGPWRYVKANPSPTSGAHLISGDRPGYLAEVRDCGSGDVGANARLIAAAPDLLAAAQRVFDDAHDRGETHDKGSDVLYADWQALADAIAKAKGTP